MAKLKQIILQLAESDFQAIYTSLSENSAEKSAFLLKAMRDKKASDVRIMTDLEVNTNAYYTLRSRLNQKIEEYLVQQMESPRADLLKKVADINEIVFTKKRTIAIATLRKLEKELLDYDLSNELTVIYKTLKKLHINSSEHFAYSQLYNKYVGYMLAVDKSEDILATYFKRFGEFTLTGDENHKLELVYITREMDNNCNLYQSHRLFVYQSCLSIFHRLFVEKDTDADFTADNKKKPIEDILDEVEKTFETYTLDAHYFHLELVFEYLKLEYYTHYKLYRKAEGYFEDINENMTSLLNNYSLYTYPAQFLPTKIDRYLRTENETSLFKENESIFDDFDCDLSDVPKYLNYVAFRSISCYYAQEYEKGARWINKMLNEISLKKYPYAMLEVKSILALQYCFLKDKGMFNQLASSIQRQIRVLGKNGSEAIIIFIKILKISMSDVQSNKEKKILALIDKFQRIPQARIFCPTKQIRLDARFVEALSK